MDFYPDDIVSSQDSGFGSPNYNFDFLDNYIRNITRPNSTNPNQVVDNGNDFYEEKNDDQEQVSQQERRDVAQDQEPDQEDFLNQSMGQYIFGDDEHNALLDYMLNYSSDQDTEDNTDADTDSGFSGEPGSGGGEKPSLRNQISAKETQGDYSATNPNSSATGKYQFLWSQWGDSIKKVTGVKSQKDFLENPQAQEKFYSFYEKKYLLPQVKELKSQVKTNLTDDELAKLIHFRGETGAKKYLQGKASDKPEKYNMKTSEYIHQAGGFAPKVQTTQLTPGQEKQYQVWRNGLPENLQYEGDYDLRGLWLSNPNVKPSANLHFPDTYKLPNHKTFSNESIYFNNKTKPFAGYWMETDSSWNYIPYNPILKDTVIEHKQMGGVAMTPAQQFTGLNDPSFDSMMFPLTGVNTFRGLDSGEPVEVHDNFGNHHILRGPHHTARMRGTVYEKRKYGL